MGEVSRGLTDVIRNGWACRSEIGIGEKYRRNVLGRIGDELGVVGRAEDMKGCGSCNRGLKGLRVRVSV